MCDPIGAIGLAFSIGMQLSNMAAQRDLASKQQAANDAWLAYQRRKAKEENARQERLRMESERTRQEGMAKLQPDEQMAAREKEQGRLEGALLEGKPVDVTEAEGRTIGDQLISGYGDMKSNVQDYYARGLANATRDARARVQALSAIQSYGGSQFGMANRANDIFGDIESAIRFSANQRRGSLAAYANEKAVEPLKYAIGAGASSAASIGQGAAGVAGGMIGRSIGQA